MSIPAADEVAGHITYCCSQEQKKGELIMQTFVALSPSLHKREGFRKELT
jgi:hypothetical protein